MTLPRMPKAVVFDMDGVLIDTETLYRDSFLAASQDGGHDLPVELYQRVCGSPWDVISGTILTEHGADFPMDAFRDAWLRHLAVSMAGGVELKAGVVKMLDLLDDLKLPRAIATSSRHESVNRHLGVDPAECLALEDSYHGVQSASSAGMMTVMVPDVAPATERMRETCIAICSGLSEVAALLRDERTLG